MRVSFCIGRTLSSVCACVNVDGASLPLLIRESHTKFMEARLEIALNSIVIKRLPACDF